MFVLTKAETTAIIAIYRIFCVSLIIHFTLVTTLFQPSAAANQKGIEGTIETMDGVWIQLIGIKWKPADNHKYSFFFSFLWARVWPKLSRFLQLIVSLFVGDLSHLLDDALMQRLHFIDPVNSKGPISICGISKWNKVRWNKLPCAIGIKECDKWWGFYPVTLLIVILYFNMQDLEGSQMTMIWNTISHG